MTRTSGAQLAAWIRTGLALPNIIERCDSFGEQVDDDFRGCALFICLAGKLGSAAAAYRTARGCNIGDFADELEIDHDFADDISYAHCYGLTAIKIADRLEGGTVFRRRRSP